MTFSPVFFCLHQFHDFNWTHHFHLFLPNLLKPKNLMDHHCEQYLSYISSYIKLHQNISTVLFTLILKISSILFLASNCQNILQKHWREQKGKVYNYMLGKDSCTFSKLLNRGCWSFLLFYCLKDVSTFFVKFSNVYTYGNSTWTSQFKKV